jgi:hypothetical protein
VKPGKKDIAIRIKILGKQLEELQQHAWQSRTLWQYPNNQWPSGDGNGAKKL